MSRSRVLAEDLPDLIRSVNRSLPHCKLGAPFPAAPPIHVTYPAGPAHAVSPAASPTVRPAEPAAPRRTPPLLAPVSMPVVVSSQPPMAAPARIASQQAAEGLQRASQRPVSDAAPSPNPAEPNPAARSEEHTSELQSLLRISYAVFCLQKKKH